MINTNIHCDICGGQIKIIQSGAGMIKETVIDSCAIEFEMVVIPFTQTEGGSKAIFNICSNCTQIISGIKPGYKQYYTNCSDVLEGISEKLINSMKTIKNEVNQ